MGSHPSLRAQVDGLVLEFHQRLGENLMGVYLHGSLAMGCFNPADSDIDLLVLVRDQLSAETRRDLARLLLDSSTHPSPLEISVLCRQDLDPWRYPTPYSFHYSEDWRERYERALATATGNLWDSTPRFDEDLAAHITVTRQRGVCLWGEPIARALPDVPPEHYRASLLADMAWARERLEQYPVDSVLNACRVYAYLREGLIVSKVEGAAWGLGALPREHRAVLAAALAAYQGEAGATPLDLGAVRAFTEYVRERAK